MRIISISGLDGSGKSTQIELLKKNLESQGKKVFYFHAIQFSIANILNKNKSAGNAKGVMKAGKFKIILRLLAMRIDIRRFRKLLKKLEKEDFDFVISDRFFYDSAINIAYLMSKKSPPGIEKILPRPNIAFYLKTDPEAIMKRSRVPEQGLSYLKDKKELYDFFSGLWGMEVLDGNESLENISAKIFEKIKNHPDQL